MLALNDVAGDDSEIIDRLRTSDSFVFVARLRQRSRLPTEDASEQRSGRHATAAPRSPQGFLSCATLADADAAGPGVVCVITPRSARVLGPHSWTPARDPPGMGRAIFPQRV